MHPPRRCMASQPRQTSLSPPTASSYSHKLKLGACGSRNSPRSASQMRIKDIMCASRGNIPSAHFIMTRRLSACSFSKRSTDRPSIIHSRRSLFFVTPPMCCLDVVRMIVPPRSSHSFRILVVRGHVVVIREVLVADSANPALLHNLSVQKFPHLGRGSQFPISARVMRIFNSLNSKSDYLRPGKKLPPTARNRARIRHNSLLRPSLMAFLLKKRSKVEVSWR